MEPYLNWNMLFSLAVAAFVAFIVIPSVVRIARSKQLVALPNGRTSHNGAVPALGGIAIFIATVIAASLFLQPPLDAATRYIIPALMIIFFVGLMDDIVHVNARIRLVVQVIVSLLIVGFGDIRISTFHGFLGVNQLPLWASILFSVFVFVSMINAFNLIDGIDGLASGLGIQISVILGILLFYIGQQNYALLAFALAGSLMPFYIYNVFGKKYKLFMGDSGSLLIGTIITMLAVKVICCPVDMGNLLYLHSLPVVIMALMIIPIMDTLKVFALRMLRGKSPFFADRIHFHHDLLRIGLTHWQSSTVIILTNTSIFIFAVVFRNIHPLLLLFLVFLLGGMALVAPVLIKKTTRKSPAETKTRRKMIFSR